MFLLRRASLSILANIQTHGMRPRQGNIPLKRVDVVDELVPYVSSETLFP